jgi:plastocyanin
MNLRPLLACGLWLAAFGCEEKKVEPPPPIPITQPSGSPAAASGAPAAPVGDKGEIKGKVTVTGKIPVMEDLKRNSDAFCAKKQMKDESVVAGKKGELANVLVHLNGLPATPPPKEKAALSQDDCMYRPRVQGMVTGQPLEIRNGDPVLHNVHTYEGARTLFNIAQVPGTPNVEKTFTQNGTMLKFKCDVHQWMTAYIWVQNNRYFAVTGDDGTFELKDIPVGTWEITAWHERFGTKTAKVVVEKDKPADVKFEFAATETAAAK